MPPAVAEGGLHEAHGLARRVLHVRPPGEAGAREVRGVQRDPGDSQAGRQVGELAPRQLVVEQVVAGLVGEALVQGLEVAEEAGDGAAEPRRAPDGVGAGAALGAPRPLAGALGGGVADGREPGGLARPARREQVVDAGEAGVPPEVDEEVEAEALVILVI